MTKRAASGAQGAVIAKKSHDPDHSVCLFCYRCLSPVQEEFGRAGRPFLEQSLLPDRYQVPVAAGHGAGSVPLARVTGSEPEGHPAWQQGGISITLRAQGTCPGN